MKTRLTRSRCSSACWSLSTARIWPTISPALRLRFSPSSAVMQKAHGDSLADIKVGNGKFEHEPWRAPHPGGRLGNDFEQRCGHRHRFAINLHHKLGHHEDR